MEQVEYPDDPKSETAPKVTSVKVRLTRGYWLGAYEVTQGEWKQVMGSEPWKGHETPLAGIHVPPKEGNDFPATFITWDGAMQFCGKLTEGERKAGRLPDGWEYTLPSEAQWEHACRARTETRFSFGDDESKLGEYAWFNGNARTGANHTLIALARRSRTRGASMTCTETLGNGAETFGR